MEQEEMGSDAAARTVRARLTRRTFLRTGSIGAVAVGMAGSVPALSGMLTTAETAPAEVDGIGSDTPALAGPIVAHITDLANGEVSLYVGERAIVTRDPALVASLLRAAR